MKILEINKFNFPNGGADRHFLDVVSLFENRGFETAVFAMNHPKNHPSIWQKYFVSYVGYSRDDSNPWQKIKGVFRMFYSFEAKRKMKKLIDDFQPDIVHIHNIYHQISPSILGVIKKRGIPVIMTVHDYKLIYPGYLLMDEKNIEESFFTFVRRKRFKKSYFGSFIVALEFHLHKFFDIYDKYIDLYIVPSQKVREMLIKRGMSEKKMRVVNHFTRLDNVAEIQAENSKERYALYFGQISKEKGVDNLINIFKSIDNIKLYLAGPMSCDFEIKENGGYKYLGVLKKRELEKYISKALFTVSASKLSETFGLIALESVAQGKPFVGFETGAFGEIITSGVQGYLAKNDADFREKIEKISKDEKLRNLFSQNALKRSRDFSDEKYYHKFRQLAEEMRDA